MTHATEKTLTHRLTVMYDHRIFTPGLATNIFKQYATPHSPILAAAIRCLPSVNTPTHFPDVCGRKAE
jgi:hypothetical protein